MPANSVKPKDNPAVVVQPVTKVDATTLTSTANAELVLLVSPTGVDGEVTTVNLSTLATDSKLELVRSLLAGTLITAPTSSGDVANSLVDGRITVATPGTAVALRATLVCKWVLVTALKTNTNQVNVGGSDVLAASGSSTGQPLGAGESVSIPVNDAAKVFVDARVAGEGVSFTVGS